MREPLCRTIPSNERWVLRGTSKHTANKKNLHKFIVVRSAICKTAVARAAADANLREQERWRTIFRIRRRNEKNDRINRHKRGAFVQLLRHPLSRIQFTGKSFLKNTLNIVKVKEPWNIRTKTKSTWAKTQKTRRKINRFVRKSVASKYN